MRYLWIMLALSACVVFTACGGEDGGESGGTGGGTGGGGESGVETGGGGGGSMAPTVAGTWTLDKDATKQELESRMAGEKDNPVAGMLQGGAAAVLESVKVEFEFKPDGSFVGNVGTGDDAPKVKGTWKLTGEKLSITTVKRGGSTLDTPDMQVAQFKDGQISLEVAGLRVPALLKRK